VWLYRRARWATLRCSITTTTWESPLTCGFGSKPLPCYFAATTPEYVACGPVILDAALDAGWDNFQLSTMPDGAT
jgi:hypothetical protein